MTKEVTLFLLLKCYFCHFDVSSITTFFEKKLGQPALHIWNSRKILPQVIERRINPVYTCLVNVGPKTKNKKNYIIFVR